MSKRKSDPKLIAVIAADSRNRTEQEILFHVGQIAKKLIKTFVRSYGMLIDNQESEKLFGQLAQISKDAGVDPGIWARAQRESVIKLLGDPYGMYFSNMTLHHAIPYVNPMAIRLNVHPMGLPKPDEKGKPTKDILEFVEPGEIIYIPQPYTVGGKYSTLAGTAPQLKPCPRMVDDSLDLTPLTYAEWCSFREADTLSRCCDKGIVWSDLLCKLICAKCGEPTSGY